MSVLKEMGACFALSCSTPKQHLGQAVVVLHFSRSQVQSRLVMHIRGDPFRRQDEQRLVQFERSSFAPSGGRTEIAETKVFVLDLTVCPDCGSRMKCLRLRWVEEIVGERSGAQVILMKPLMQTISSSHQS
jgi:hypothetical protein